MATSVAKWLILGREHPFFINFTEEPVINEEVSIWLVVTLPAVREIALS
jgi:hypothetical protein